MPQYSSDKTAFDYYYLQQDGAKTLECVDPKGFGDEYSVYDVWMEKVSPETTYEHLRITTVSSEQVESLPKCPMRDWLVSQNSGLNFSFIFNEYPHGEENKWVSDNWEKINVGGKANPVLRRIRGNIVLAVLTDSFDIDGNFYLPITEVMDMIKGHFAFPGVLKAVAGNGCGKRRAVKTKEQKRADHLEAIARKANAEIRAANARERERVENLAAIAREKEVRQKEERKRIVHAKKKEEERIRFEQAKNVTYTDSKLKPASLPDHYTSSDSGYSADSADSADSGEETKPRKIKRRDAKVEAEPVVKESKNSAKKALKKAAKASRKK